jgi:hypothetical protein
VITEQYASVGQFYVATMPLVCDFNCTLIMSPGIPKTATIDLSLARCLVFSIGVVKLSLNIWTRYKEMGDG